MPTNLSNLKGEQIGKTAFIEEDQTGPNFEGIPFKVASGKKPPLDGFAVVERDDSESLHYGRISSGQEVNPDAEAKKMSRDESYDISNDDVRRGDMNPNVTRVMTVEILGEIKEEEDGDGDKKLVTHQPEDLPQTGQGVFEVSAEKIHKLLNTPEPGSDEGFKIGTISSGDGESEYRLPEKVPARHIAILGRTGTGKTHTAHVVVEELINQEIPVISFDVLDDAENMATELGGQTLKPAVDFEIPFSLIGYSEFSGFMPHLTDSQEDVVSTAYEEVHRIAMTRLRGEETGIDEDQEIDFEFFLDKMDQVDSQSDRVVNNAKSKVRPALRASFLGESMEEDWTELMSGNPMLNIDIGHLGQKNRTLVIAALARILQRLRDQEDIPPFALLIDEAHKYIPSDSSDSASTAVIRDLVQTARHIGIGTILISQSPSSLDDTALRTCNTHIVLALDNQEMSSVKGLFGDVSQSTLDRVPKLEKGLAMVGSARDLIQHTSKVNIRERNTEEGAPTPELASDAQDWFDDHEKTFGGGL